MSKNKVKLVSKKRGEAIAWNDADYQVQPKVNGKQVNCPYYQAWVSMIKRAYSSKLHTRRPTYVGVTVCPEWLTFSVFKAWMVTQDWQGKQLDKDLIFPGNKIYGPKNCIFVSRQLNTLMTDYRNGRGDLPRGIYWDEARSKFKAQCKVDGKSKHLGRFSTVHDAQRAYIDFKQALILGIISTMEDSPLKRGLEFHSWLL